MTDAQIAMLTADVYLASFLGKGWMTGILFLIHIFAYWMLK